MTAADRELTIDKEFAGLCPDLTPEEVDLLEASITADGCRDPIDVWANHKDTILDGHNRYRICRRFKVPFKTRAVKLDTREEAVNWIISTALGRRNLTDQQKSYLRGKRYIGEKKAEGGRADRDFSGDHNDLPKTADRLAKQLNVSAPTIKRDAKFAQAVDAIEKSSGPEAKKAILAGKTKATKKDVVAIAALPKDKQQKAIAGNRTEVKRAVREAKQEKLPAWAKGPTPEEQAKNAPARRWCASLHKLYVFMNSTRKAGGIAELTAAWSDHAKVDYVAELREIVSELNQWIKILEKHS